MKAVDVETAQLEPILDRTTLVPSPHRLEEMREFDVAPHPAGEVDEGAAPAPNAMLADEAIEFRGIGPIPFDSEDAESMLLDEPLRDRRTGSVELGGPM